MRNLPNKEFRQLVPKLRKKGFYKPQEQRKISWPEYNLNQINDLDNLLVFIRESVDATIPLNTEGNVGRPLTNPRSLAKAILFCEMIGLPERHAQGWLKFIGPYLGIHEKLDDRVIGEAYDRSEVAYILYQVFKNNRSSDGILSGDGTGLETSRKQNYESTKRCNGEYMTNIVDSREIVQAFDISNKGECEAMKGMIKYVSGDVLTLDAGLNDRGLARMIAENGMKPFIFPKKNNKLNGGVAWKSMYLSLFKDVFGWLKIYHQRSHAESFYSSLKRVYGILTKVRFQCRLTQIIARIILHNYRRLSYFKMIEN